MGPGGTATSGMGPQGAAEGPRGTATWDRVIKGIFFLISVQQILNFSQSGEELCGASQAVQTDGHLFHQNGEVLETNNSWTRKYFNGEDLATFFPLLPVQRGSILRGAM